MMNAILNILRDFVSKIATPKKNDVHEGRTSREEVVSHRSKYSLNEFSTVENMYSRLRQFEEKRSSNRYCYITDMISSEEDESVRAGHSYSINENKDEILAYREIQHFDSDDSISSDQNTSSTTLNNSTRLDHYKIPKLDTIVHCPRFVPSNSNTPILTIDDIGMVYQGFHERAYREIQHFDSDDSISSDQNTSSTTLNNSTRLDDYKIHNLDTIVQCPRFVPSNSNNPILTIDDIGMVYQGFDERTYREIQHFDSDDSVSSVKTTSSTTLNNSTRLDNYNLPKLDTIVQCPRFVPLNTPIDDIGMVCQGFDERAYREIQHFDSDDSISSDQNTSSTTLNNSTRLDHYKIPNLDTIVQCPRFVPSNSNNPILTIDDIGMVCQGFDESLRVGQSSLINENKVEILKNRKTQQVGSGDSNSFTTDNNTPDCPRSSSLETNPPLRRSTRTRKAPKKLDL